MKERVNKQTEGRRWVGATRIAIVQLYPDFAPSLVPFLMLSLRLQSWWNYDMI